MAFHQIGASAQHVVEQAFAKNKNGVPMQWIIQSELAIIPKLS
mgnify:CR=1 FL=1